MDGSTPPTFDYLHRLPPEIRAMIFEYMVLNTIPPNFHERRCVPLTASEISGVWSHLISSPWVTLNKQYCVEYSKAFLNRLELIANIAWSAGGRAKPDVGRMSMLKACIQIISHRSKMCFPQIGIEELWKTLYPSSKGLCLFHYDQLFSCDFGWTESPYWAVEYTITRPLKQLRRHHEKYNIPSNKISIHIHYGSPSGAFAAFCYKQDGPSGPHFDTLLRSVQARIWVADYDASVAAIEAELRVLRTALDEALRKLRIRYSKPKHLSDLLALETMVEGDMEILRRLHMRTIEQTTNFWKAQDGWYDLDDMFRIAESWASEPASDGLMEHLSTSALVDEIQKSNRFQSSWRIHV